MRRGSSSGVWETHEVYYDNSLSPKSPKVAYHLVHDSIASKIKFLTFENFVIFCLISDTCSSTGCGLCTLHMHVYAKSSYNYTHVEDSCQVIGSTPQVQASPKPDWTSVSMLEPS